MNAGIQVTNKKLNNFAAIKIKELLLDFFKSHI